MLLKLTLLVMIALVSVLVQAFTPSRNMELLTEVINFDLDEKPASATLTHMDILQRGLVRSLTKYFAESQKINAHLAKHTVRMDKADTVYLERIGELYKDYLGEEDYKVISECGLRVHSVMNELAEAVANVDFDKQLKDLPWAHFDANTFVESNR